MSKRSPHGSVLLRGYPGPHFDKIKSELEKIKAEHPDIKITIKERKRPGKEEIS